MLSIPAIVMVILCAFLPMQPAKADKVKVELDESRGLTFNNGRLLHITWQLHRMIPYHVRTPYSVRLLSVEPGRAVRNITDAFVRITDHQQWWWIASDVPEGEYAIYFGVGEPVIANKWHQYSGWSKIFTILNPALLEPGRSNLFPTLNISPLDSPSGQYLAGGTVAVEFQAECCNGNVEFTLRRGSEPSYRRLVGRVPYYCPARLDKYNWKIPQNLRDADDYFLAAKAGRCFKTSRPLRIAPPIGDAGGSPGDSPYHIDILSPSEGDIYYWGQNVWLQVHFGLDLPHGVIDDARVKLAFTKNGEEVWSLAQHYLHMSSPVRVLGSPTTFASGNDYRVRSELSMVDWSSGAEIHLADDETGDFTIVNNRADCDAGYPVVVKSPRSPEAPTATFFIGDDIEIMWCSHPRGIGRVRIDLVRDSRDGGGSREIIARASNADPHLTWIIPDDIAPGGGYRVRVEKLDGSAYDVNSWPFNIIRR